MAKINSKIKSLNQPTIKYQQIASSEQYNSILTDSLVDSVKFSFQTKASTQNCNIKVTKSADFPSQLKSQPVTLRRLINILIFNAIEYSSGKVDIYFFMSEKQDDVDTIFISFFSNGRGFDQEHINNIFSKDKSKDFNQTKNYDLSKYQNMNQMPKFITKLNGTQRFIKNNIGSFFYLILPNEQPEINDEVKLTQINVGTNENDADQEKKLRYSDGDTVKFQQDSFVSENKVNESISKINDIIVNRNKNDKNYNQ